MTEFLIYENSSRFRSWEVSLNIEGEGLLASRWRKERMTFRHFGGRDVKIPWLSSHRYIRYGIAAIHLLPLRYTPSFNVARDQGLNGPGLVGAED